VPTFWAPLRGRYIRCGILPRPAQKDMRALDQKDVVRLLRSEVKQEGSQKTWAKSTVLLRQRSAWFFRAIGRRTTRSLARSNSAGSLYSNELMNRAGHPATATPLGQIALSQMRPRLPSEQIKPFRPDRTEHLDMLARQAARWAKDHTAAIAEIDPKMPAGIFNREATSQPRRKIN